LDRATFVAPHQYPAGIDLVVVNGRIAVEGNQHTGSYSGRVLRHGAV
jgi:N-acyl-D-aspartate/D-glutamate deacylase